MNRKNNVKTLLVILLLAILLAACSPSAPQGRTIDVDTLYSGAWHLVAYGNDEGSSIVTPGLRTFVSFEQDGSLFGNAGCNNFFGTYKAEKDGSFSVIEPLGSTMMFCEQFMEEEAAFLAALQSSEGFFFNGEGQLVINFSETTVGFTFMTLVNRESVSLVGTGWVLESLVTPEGEFTVLAATAPLLSFSEDGSLAGSGGCNRIMTQFTAEDGRITINPIASALMYCDGLMELEGSFTAALEKATRYDITGDRLVLSDESFINVLTFMQAEFMLTETQWQLNIFNGESIPEELVVTLTLSPEGAGQEGTVFGSTGCNRYSGSYTLEADQLNINVLVVTAMMCDFGMETETAFLAALQDPLTYQIEFNRLVLVSEKNALIFVGEKPSLAGLWRVSLLGDPQNPVEMTFDQTILAKFILEEEANTGLLSGSTPCQDYSARFFVDRNLISISMQEINDLGQCRDGSELDSQYFDALEKAVTYEFSRGNVLLQDMDGKQVLEFSIQY